MDEFALFENDPDESVLSARLSLRALDKSRPHGVGLSGRNFFGA